MEDFIERVGQSYLERKAFAAPQQLENFAKKQLTGTSEEGAKAKTLGEKKAIEEEKEGKKEEETRITEKKGSGRAAGQTLSGILEKDKEIARLKKQLAQVKLENSKASSKKSTLGLTKSGITRASSGQKAFTSKAAKGKKGTKELAVLEAAGVAGGRHAEEGSKSGGHEEGGSKLAREADIVEISPPKRKPSTSQHNKHNDGAKSEHGGGSKSEHGGRAKSTTSHSDTASEGKRTFSIASLSEHGDYAKSTTSHAASASKSKRTPSIASQSEHGGYAKSITSHAAATSEGTRRPSIASQSEHGGHAKSITSHAIVPLQSKRAPSIASQSEHGGYAKSSTSHAAAAPEGNRRPSIASHSEHGSTAMSIAPIPLPVHNHLPTHAECFGEHTGLVESRLSIREYEQGGDLYTVEVEEEVPRDGRRDAGGVVEVEWSQGRTVYQV